jgi:argininosuccinate lyase
MRKATAAGFLTATDLADWLVRAKGLPFREAHHVTGRAVKLAEEKRVGLEELPLADLQTVHPGITEDVFPVLMVENAVKARTSYGGTAPDRVREQITYWRQELGHKELGA